MSEEKWGLGWYKSPEDPRDWSPDILKAMVRLGSAEPIAWEVPNVLSQGSTNKCVGFSWATYVSSGTATSPPDAGVGNELGAEIYRLAKLEEGITEDDANFGEGAYLRSGAKACKKLGLISAWSLTVNHQAAEEWLEQSAVVCGLPWYNGMFYPDNAGVIHPTGRYEGGHAICWAKNHQPKPADNGLVNTWGVSWGKDGWCFISDPELYDLAQNGEFCLAVKIKGVPYVDAYAWSEEDLLALNYLYVQEIMQGKIVNGRRYFMPTEYLTYRHVALVAGRVGLEAPKDWKKRYELCPRSVVRDTFPALVWNQERWEEPISRLQAALLIYRWKKG